MKAKHKKALARMGVTNDVLAHVKASKTRAEGQQRLTEAKTLCKKGFRTLALETHPDVGGDADEFRFHKDVYEGFMGSKFKLPRKHAQPVNMFWSTGWDSGHDQLMKNFRRMKEEQRRRAEQETLEDLLRRMCREGTFTPRPVKPPKHKPTTQPQQEFYLEERKGIWRKNQGRTLPHPEDPRSGNA